MRQGYSKQTSLVRDLLRVLIKNKRIGGPVRDHSECNTAKNQGVQSRDEKEALHQINRRTVFKILSWDYVDPNKPNIEIPKYHPPVRGEEDNGEHAPPATPK